MSFTMSMAQQRKPRAAYVAWLPIALSVVSIVTTATWFHFATLALGDTRVIAALISIPLPAPFATYLPALLAASLAFVILQAVLLCGLYTWRSLHQYAADADADDTDTLSTPPKQYRTKPLAVASGIATALQYFTLLWFVFMLALSMLWMGGGLVASNATMDGAATMAVVDDTMPRLIQNAMGIDPRKQGYLVHVNGRDVNIGSGTCSLFCFTLARAMMADTIECTCNEQLAAQLMPPGNKTTLIDDTVTCSSAPVMCAINAIAFKLYKQHMKPAVICILITVLCLMGLLSTVSGTHARIKTELRQGARLSRASSTEADLRISTGSDSDDGPVKPPRDAHTIV